MSISTQLDGVPVVAQKACLTGACVYNERRTRRRKSCAGRNGWSGHTPDAVLRAMTAPDNGLHGPSRKREEAAP